MVNTIISYTLEKEICVYPLLCYFGNLGEMYLRELS